MKSDAETSSDKSLALARMVAAIRSSQNATDMMDEAFAGLLGVNRTDARCLDIVSQKGRVTAGELARQAGLTTGAVTAVIDRLERADYLVRQRDPADRRKIWVELTARTRELADIVYGQIGKVGRNMMGGMPVADMELITRFMLANAHVNRMLAERLRQAQAAAREETPVETARRFDEGIGESLSEIIAEMVQAWTKAGTAD